MCPKHVRSWLLAFTLAIFRTKKVTKIKKSQKDQYTHARDINAHYVKTLNLDKTN